MSDTPESLNYPQTPIGVTGLSSQVQLECSIDTRGKVLLLASILKLPFQNSIHKSSGCPDLATQLFIPTKFTQNLCFVQYLVTLFIALSTCKSWHFTNIILGINGYYQCSLVTY